MEMTQLVLTGRFSERCRTADCKFQLVSSQIFGMNWALNSMVSSASFSFDLIEYKKNIQPKHFCLCLIQNWINLLNEYIEKTVQLAYHN